MSEQLPAGARVRFEATFSVGTRTVDPKNPSATVMQSNGSRTYTKVNGLRRSDSGAYYVDVDLDRAGTVIVKFDSGDGGDQEQTYIVMDDAAAPTAVPRADVLPSPVAPGPTGIRWPDGYDRRSAIAALSTIGVRVATQQDSYILGALTQHLKTKRFDALASHDDTKSLPDREDEARARRLASTRLPGKDAMAVARREVRMAILSKGR